MDNETYSLWLEPSGNKRDYFKEKIEQLSSRYHTPSFNPHVTLLGGLEKSPETTIPLLNSLAASTKPVPISLTEVGYRDQFYQCLFIHAKSSAPLLNLRKKASELFDIPGGEYMPHLSLVYGDFDKKHKQEMISRIGRTFDMRFKVSNVALVETSGKPKNWQKVHTSVLK